jgi:hypothetical protein
VAIGFKPDFVLPRWLELYRTQRLHHFVIVIFGKTKMVQPSSNGLHELAYVHRRNTQWSL